MTRQTQAMPRTLADDLMLLVRMKQEREDHEGSAHLDVFCAGVATTLNYITDMGGGGGRPSMSNSVPLATRRSHRKALGDGRGERGVTASPSSTTSAIWAPISP